MTTTSRAGEVVALLESLRRAEKEQALAYRAIAARAESDDAPELAQRFHDLHADEQHHLSRLTARLLELGERPSELQLRPPTLPPPAEWHTTIQHREAAEIERYQNALATHLDSSTRALLEEILEVEKQHATQLGGKWTIA